MAFAVELYAGPGGWSEGLAQARPDLRSIGFEWDHYACETGKANGHDRVFTDVTLVDPSDYAGAIYIHASPPCQGFSSEGNREGRKDKEDLLEAVRLIGESPDDVERIIAGVSERASDERSALTLEHLRWIVRMGYPEYVTLEQVPPVLPIWEAMAEVLETWGYSTWTGILHGEQYGVPSTRKRAILVARRGEQPVHPPTPTHSKYNTHDPYRMEEGVLPWVSIEEALGLDEEMEREWFLRSQNVPEELWDSVDCGGSLGYSWSYQPSLGARPNMAVRATDQPAPTLTAGNNVPHQWVMRPGIQAAVQVWEAGVLLGFPEDYDWRYNNAVTGFRQVADAVPPPLARAVVDALLPVDIGRV